jgi:hypothetical protein
MLWSNRSSKRETRFCKQLKLTLTTCYMRWSLLVRVRPIGTACVRFDNRWMPAQRRSTNAEDQKRNSEGFYCLSMDVVPHKCGLGPDAERAQTMRQMPALEAERTPDRVPRVALKAFGVLAPGAPDVGTAEISQRKR